MSDKNIQTHPLEHLDRPMLQRIRDEGPSDYNLAELARLRIRYQGFLGAYALQEDIEKILQQWQLSPEQLYAKTREIHARGNIYRNRGETEEGSAWDVGGA